MNESMVGQPPAGDWLGTKHLRFERHGALAHCVVDRPSARNLMTAAMYFGVRYATNRVDADPDLAGLLITGVGDVFIPGGDLSDETNGDGWANLMDLLFTDNSPFDAIRQATKPIVTAVNGICQGGGLVIAMLSDVAVASDRAVFRVPELYRGIADTYYAQVLPRHIGMARARDLMFTGRTFTAEEAVDWGIISRAVPHDELLDTATDVLAACCRTAPDARVNVKRAFDAQYGLHDRIGLARSLRGPEVVEGFNALKERRSPAWVPAELQTDGRL